MSKLAPELKQKWVARLRATPNHERIHGEFREIDPATNKPCFCALGHLLDIVGFDWSDDHNEGYKIVENYISFSNMIAVWRMSDEDETNETIAYWIEKNL